MDLKYTRKKLTEAAIRAEHAKAMPHEVKMFNAFTGAMDAFYACIEWLPDDLQVDARKVYDTLNAAMEDE